MKQKVFSIVLTHCWNDSLDSFNPLYDSLSFFSDKWHKYPFYSNNCCYDWLVSKFLIIPPYHKEKWHKSKLRRILVCNAVGCCNSVATVKSCGKIPNSYVKNNKTFRDFWHNFTFLATKLLERCYSKRLLLQFIKQIM